MKKWLLHIAAVSIVVIFTGLLIVYHNVGARHRETTIHQDREIFENSLGVFKVFSIQLNKIHLKHEN